MIPCPRLRFLALGACVAGLASLASASQAAVTTATFTVTADVETTCRIAANNLNFGPYIGTQLDVTTTVQAACSVGVPYSVGLNAGTSTGATVTARKMTGPGTGLLNYGLFQDAGHSVNWGDTIGTDTVAGTGTGAIQTLNLYGRIPPNQFLGPGAYSDTITATLTF